METLLPGKITELAARLSRVAELLCSSVDVFGRVDGRNSVGSKFKPLLNGKIGGEPNES